MNKNNKNTIFVNLIASPGSGKSTLMGDIFSTLKWDGIDCEMATEFAKDLVWEERKKTFEDNTYIFAKQNHRLLRLKGKVDVVITDSPLILTILYNNNYGDKSKELDALALSEFNKYNNLNYFIIREKEYNPNGRNQTEEESNLIADQLEIILVDNHIKYNKVLGVKETTNRIVDDIKWMLKHANAEYLCEFCGKSLGNGYSNDFRFLEKCPRCREKIQPVII